MDKCMRKITINNVCKCLILELNEKNKSGNIKKERKSNFDLCIHV